MRIADSFEPHGGPGGEWLSGRGADADIVISSRVRLARNVRGHRFLIQAGEDEKAEDGVREATEEHALVKGLVAELEEMSASDEQFDAKVKVLSERVRTSSLRRPIPRSN